MIPYIHVPDLRLGFLTLHPFGLLVATGVIIGTWLAIRRARQRGLDLEKLNSFITWMLLAGFTGGHMLDQIFYHPAEVLRRPWSLLMLWEGLSSFGGFIGGVTGIFLWKYFEAVPILPTPLFVISKFRKRPVPMPVMPFCDLILSVFPVAWVFGRSGCATVHDHLGMQTTPGFWLAVASGSPPLHTTYLTPKLVVAGRELMGPIELRFGATSQFDLGLLEMLFTVIVATLFALTWRRKLTTGSYIAAVALAYAPVRFAMDFLRKKGGLDSDPRYGFLTPAQWACMGLFSLGLFMVWQITKLRKSGVDPMDQLVAPGVPLHAPEVPIEAPPEPYR